MRKRTGNGTIVRGARQWFRIVDEWRRSGQTTAEFCSRRGLNSKTFQWWRWAAKKPGRAGGGEVDVPRATCRRGLPVPSEARKPQPAPAFVEVVSPALRPSPVPRRDSGVAIVIERADTKRQVRLEPDFDATTLLRVVRLLEEV